jgi:LPXTG-motif cell wall-anchored protein
MPFKDYSSSIADVIGGGLKFFGSQEERKSAEAQADALKSKGYSDVEVAKLMLEGKKLELQTALAGGNKKSGSNNTLYIALGVGGVLILGLVIFAVTRKKS